MRVFKLKFSNRNRIWCVICAFLILFVVIGCNAPSPDEDAVAEPPAEESSFDDDEPTIESPAAPTLGSLLQTAVDAMQNGQIAFNTPQEMQAGITQEITARIIDSQTEEATQTLLEGLDEVEEDVQVETLSVSSEMRAELIASEPGSFEIVALSDAQQLIVSGQLTEWQWEVTPLRRGDAKLILRVTAVIEVPGFTPKSRSLPVLERDIEVQVNPSYSLNRFLAQNWWWLLLVTLILVATVIILRRRTKTVFLFLGANPDSTGGIREDKEIEAIDSAIQSAQLRQKLELEKHFAVKFADVDDLIRRYEPKIVHFSGHGSDTYELIFEGRGMFHDTVSSDELIKLFERVEHEVDCVVLNACFSKPLAEGISNHVGCVIGTSRELGDNTAILFSSEFYRAIADGAPLGNAYNSARDVIDSELGNQMFQNESETDSELSDRVAHKPQLICNDRKILSKSIVRRSLM